MVLRKIKEAFKKESNDSKLCINRCLLFVHIPKTAGTSFRSALETMFKVFNDYGQKSKQTSAIIQKYFYEKNDVFTLKQQFNLTPNACISGHVSVNKFMDFVPVESVVTFVREPSSQILSHYNHHLAHLGYKGSLNDFLNKTVTKNFQSTLLGALPLGLIGYVGITEKYEQSLNMFNKQFLLSLKPVKDNVNKSKQYTDSQLEKPVYEKFKRNNKQDIVMYKEALFLHEQRKSLYEGDKPWTYCAVHINANKKVLHGCAYRLDDKTPTRVIVKINNQRHDVLTAKYFYSHYTKANFPRERYIAFNVRLPENLTSNDEINLYAEDTGQKLNFKPLKINLK